jgi:hypothetical protein
MQNVCAAIPLSAHSSRPALSHAKLQSKDCNLVMTRQGTAAAKVFGNAGFARVFKNCSGFCVQRFERSLVSAQPSISDAISKPLVLKLAYQNSSCHWTLNWS